MMYKCEHDDDNDQIRIHPNEIKKTLHITHSHSIFIVAAAAAHTDAKAKTEIHGKIAKSPRDYNQMQCVYVHLLC